MAVYTIKKGDTLSDIARANGTTVDALAAANSIADVNRIRAGSTLNIPGGSDGVTHGDSAVELEPGAQADAAGAAPAAAAASRSSTTTPLSLPYVQQMLTNLQGGGYDTSGYSSVGSNYSAQMANIRQQYQQMAAQQEAAARAEAEQNRRQAYVNGRLSANRNNEQVAALGLGGNLYADPMSGYSETSRIAADNNMRTNINQVTLAEQNAVNEIALRLMEQNATLSMQEAQQLATIQLQAQQAAQSAYESNIASQLSAMGLLGDIEQYNSNMAYQRERDAIADEQWAKEFALAQQKTRSGSGSGSSYIITDPSQFGIENTTTAQSDKGNASQVLVKPYKGISDSSARHAGTRRTTIQSFVK